MCNVPGLGPIHGMVCVDPVSAGYDNSGDFNIGFPYWCLPNVANGFSGYGTWYEPVKCATGKHVVWENGVAKCIPDAAPKACTAQWECQSKGLTTDYNFAVIYLTRINEEEGGKNQYNKKGGRKEGRKEEKHLTEKKNRYICTDDDEYKVCDNGWCKCAAGFDGCASTTNQCRCDGQVYWMNGNARCCHGTVTYTSAGPLCNMDNF